MSLQKSHLTIDITPRGSQCHIVKVRLGADNHTTLPSKVEVRRRRTDVYLADEFSRGIPDLDPIATAGVDIAPRVAMNPCPVRNISI